MQEQSSKIDRQAMLKALLTAPSDPENCKDVEAQLMAYHVATLQQQETDPKWRALQQHLAQCPSCAEQYRWIQGWDESEAGLATVTAAQAAEPDLGFLYKSAPTTAGAGAQSRSIWAAFWEETVSGLLLDLGSELRNALPQQRLAAAGLRGDDQPKQGYAFVVERAQSANVYLDVEQAVDTELAVLKVTVDTEEMASDTLPEIEVVLLLHDQPTQSQFVDRHGIAKFAVASAELPFAKIAVHDADDE